MKRKLDTFDLTAGERTLIKGPGSAEAAVISFSCPSVNAGGALQIAWARDTAPSLLAAYGDRPFQALGWLAGLRLPGAVVFYNACQHDAMKPADTRSLYRGERGACARSAACFVETGAGASYPRFNALIYSADTLLPVVNLEVQDCWIPASEAGGWGALAQSFLWAQIIAGWVLLLAIAGVSGLIRRD